MFLLPPLVSNRSHESRFYLIGINPDLYPTYEWKEGIFLQSILEWLLVLQQQHLARKHNKIQSIY